MSTTAAGERARISCQEKVIAALDVKMRFMSRANFYSPPDCISTWEGIVVLLANKH